MKAQEKTAIGQAEEMQLQLEEQIAMLKTRDTELEQLSHVDDHIHFIKVPDSACAVLVWSVCVCLQSIFFTLYNLSVVPTVQTQNMQNSATDQS